MKKSNSKGITLIALVITIIVMLILVVVTINVATNGGLIDKAKEAAEGTSGAAAEEERLTSQEYADEIDQVVNGTEETEETE